MQINWEQTAPVLVSIVIILLIAVLRAVSKTVAAITATMPLNIMLALWIVYAAEEGEETSVVRFTGSMIMGVAATLACVVAMWLAAKAGWRLLPVIFVGYLAWGTTLFLILSVGRGLGAG
jgi:hypothetical protein